MGSTNRHFYARGALLGAFVGDAAGATLEFIRRIPTGEDVDHAISLVGGGVWGTAPGQITDDGELSLSLAQALADSDVIDREKVAANYRRWYESRPFDIGVATRGAFGGNHDSNQSLAGQMEEAARLKNSESKANGALMRIAPLGIWSWKLDEETAAEAARADSRLSHPNAVCQHANAAYVAAIRHLMLNPGDGSGAIDAAFRVVSREDGAEVFQWLLDARSGIGPSYYPQAGYVRIAFTHAFRHLQMETPFYDALHETLRGGGDTDTNGCIVGGLIGALHGEGGIPAWMKQTVLNCETSLGRPRPDWLSTRHVISLAERLF